MRNWLLPLRSYQVALASWVNFVQLMQQFWDKVLVPQYFKNANMIHLYKNKDDRTSCDNH